MSKCCDGKKIEVKNTDPCAPPEPCCSTQASAESPADSPLSWFQDMVSHCYDHVVEEKKRGTQLVGIMCEYTPREIIMAAGAIPVCLCGGSAEMVGPAEEHLPANLCPLIKSTFGYSVEKANPFLEMADLLVAETTCDGKKKMYEHLSERHPMVVLELPQKPDDGDAYTHWVAELGKLISELENRFSVSITEERLRRSIREMNEERRLRRELAELMKAEAPPMTGRELLDMKSLISCLPMDLDQYRKAIDILPGRALDPPAESRVRVLMTGVPLPHMAERVIEIIENNGGLVVCQDNCTGIKPIEEDVDENNGDPLEAIAKKYYHLPCSVMTPNEGRLDLLRRLVKAYRPDCIIELIWQACLTYDVESRIIKRLSEEELGLPYLRIETDYSPSDSARISMRVEALFETVKTGEKTVA